MRGRWASAMQSAFVAALARPSWWAMALAAFLVRGGIVVALLPILSLPSAAGLTTTLAPSLEALVLGRGSLEGAIVGTLLVALVLAALLAAALAGSWLDLTLVREATDDDDLDLARAPASLATRGSAVKGLAIRLAAHLPTMVAAGYAAIRLVGATYTELLDPGDTTVPLVARVLLRAPDAVIPVVLAWLLGEAIGAVAARSAAAGEPTTLAVRRAVRHVLGPAGLATLALTTLVLIAVAGAFVLTAGRAWEHLGTVLVGGADSVQLTAAVLLFVSTWMLGLALLGAALAWRGSAWTVLLSPAQVGSPEVMPAAAPEAAGG